MLTVFCVLWGDKYPAEYVYRLKKMVERHLSTSFEFICLTDHKLEGIHTAQPICSAPGWWQKISLFQIANGPSLYFDLDVVITGELMPLVPYTKNSLSMPRNWALSGHGGWQSSVMAWDGSARQIYRAFEPHRIGKPEQGNCGYYHWRNKQLWGDQEFLTELLGEQVCEINPGLIVSYRYHCISGVPDNARVVVFHGKPDYHEVSTPWVRKFAYT